MEVQDLLLIFIMVFANCIGQKQSLWRFPTSTNMDTNYFYSNNLTSADQILRGNVLLNTHKKMLKVEPTYFIVASRTIRPGQVFRIVVHILHGFSPVTVNATILKNGRKISQSSKICSNNEPETIVLKIPLFATFGKYKLHVEGYIKKVLGGIAFSNETDLNFSQQSMTIIIQTDQPLYKQGQTVNFRALPITVDLKAFKEPLDIFMLDPKGNIVKRWISHRTNFGVVSLSYSLPEQVTPGTWRIRISTQGQIEEQKYIVEEYYSTRFEVEISMPPFILDTDEFIEGNIQANYTSGAPVHANLTLLVSVHSPCIQCSDEFDHFTERFVPYFEGIHYFQISLWELRRLSPELKKKQVTVRAIVGDRLLDKKITGYASSLISSSDVILRFVGHEPQIFKPFAPLKVYLALSYEDGSAISLSHFKQYKMEIQITVIYKRDNNEQLKKRDLKMMANKPGMWEVEIDLLSEPGLNRKTLKDIKSLKLEAKYKDATGKTTQAKLTLFRQLTPNDHHISIATSTKTAKVGEYIVFHVRTNFYISKFSYLIISKGIILISGTETITSTIRTFAANVTSKMVPIATIIVYHVNIDGEIIADSLSFPVEGFPKNNFNISIHSCSGKLNDTAEIIVKGKPGLFVALSSTNEILQFFNSKNKFSLMNLLQSLAEFDSDKNGTLHHKWISKRDDENIFINFPAASYAPDSFKTFEYAGIIVFTDGNLRSLVELCKGNKNLQTCLTGKCYTLSQRCDGKADCEDGSDETRCFKGEKFDIDMWKLYRQNHIQRFYQSSWLWNDIIVGLQGNTKLNISVPKQQTQWKINGFSIGKNKVITVLEKPVQYSGGRYFYMTLELPPICKEDEVLGLQATVFNNNQDELQAFINLANSRDYKVLKVQSQTDSSSSKRGANKEFSQKIIIQPYSSSTVHIPIIPKRIGEINVTVMAQSLLGKYSVCKSFVVEPYGIPQYKHSAILLDLSNRVYLVKYFDINLTDSSEIHNQKKKTADFKEAILSVYGNMVGPLFPTIPVNTSSIFRKKCGSAEQNIFNFAINLYMLKYMNKTQIKNSILEKDIFRYLNEVYAKQLSYQTSYGGFKMFHQSSYESVWLTAICIRIFNEGNLHDWKYFLYIDPEVISKALKWLLQHQTRYGAFFEEFLIPYDQKMNMASKKKDDVMHYRNITLTAHVVITLLSVKNLDKELEENVRRSKNLAVNYLERMMKIAKIYTDPYDLAVITYALTLATSPYVGEAFDFLNQRSRDIGEGMMYWGKEVIPPPKYNVASNKPLLQARLPYKYDSLNIETTAYALLVYVKRHELFKDQIVNWLTFQRLSDAGWASTQDTLIAYQALLEYYSSDDMQGETDMSIIVDATSSPGFEKILNVNEKQISGLQRVKIPNSWGTIRLLIKGHGMAVAQLSVQYNVDDPQLQIHPPLKAFSLIVKIDYSSYNLSHLLFQSCQKWLLINESETSGMCILEIEIPTGYYIQQQDLDAYVRSHQVPQLQNAQFENRKAVFYFDYLGSTEICIHFTVERWFPVAKLTKLMHAKIYDYYAPEKFNETFIHSGRLNLINICDVCGSIDCPPCIVIDNATLMKLNFILLCSSLILQTIFCSS